MKFIETKLPDLFIIEPSVFIDDRGYFTESFNLEKFEEYIGPIKFVQDNESRSYKGVLRGLHFQTPPFAQAKLVRCIEGNVMDVAVDIRNGSPTYGMHVSVELSGQNKKQLFIPRGFAHGYKTLKDDTIVYYKTDQYYMPEDYRGFIWNDKNIDINWNVSDKDEVTLSSKDMEYKEFGYE